jgi:hypothetical protein
MFAPMPDPSAWDADHVARHVQHAVELELFTIPAYLCAYWSIRQGGGGAADAAAEALRGVVNQEMMHLQMACNLASALGCTPRLTGAAAPRYPGRVPYDAHDVEITLGPATDAQIRAFMALELPTWLEPYTLTDLPPQDRYPTIGDFYHALLHGLQAVYGADDEREREPWPSPAGAQVFGNFRDDGFAIADLDSATRALNLIVLQGEGASKTDPHGDDPGELSHYYALKALQGTLGSGDLRPMLPSTRGLGHDARGAALLDFFDACYSDLLGRLEASFHGRGAIGPAVGLMWASLNALGVYVVDVPHVPADGGDATDQTLTPRFALTTTTPAAAYARLDDADRGSDAVRGVAQALRIEG